ncbi:YfhO family protein [Candidatus Gottesmanbacteria bacterium]|nr:YfhO family protein [Candidatus Gottesmanbacteria bacterium]
MTAFGSIPLMLALLSMYSVKLSKRLLWFFAISAVGAIALSISSPLTRFIYGISIPILSTSVPSRILILAVFSLSVLAGFGVDSLLSQKRIKEMSKPMIFVGSLIVFVLLYALFLSAKHVSCPSLSISTCRMTSVRTTLFELFVFLSCSLLFLISVKVRGKWIQNIFILMSVFIFLGAGLYNAEKLLPFSPKEMMYPTSQLIAELQSLGSSERVFGIGEGKISTNIATELKIFDPEYYDPLYIKRYGQLVAYANQGVFPPILKRSDVEITRDSYVSSEINKRRERLLDLLSVTYLYGKYGNLPFDASSHGFGDLFWQSSAYRIAKRPSALQHAYLVHQYTVKNTEREILSTLFDPSFDPHISVILEKDPAVHLTDTSDLSTVSENTIEDIAQNEYLKFSVTMSNPGLFALTDNFYPGWHAKVDGKETEIFRANYSFRAVVLDKGEHTVEFIYKPQSLRNGVILSLFSLLVLVRLAWFSNLSPFVTIKEYFLRECLGGTSYVPAAFDPVKRD